MRYKRVLGGLCIATSVGVFLGFPASAIAQSIEESESKTGTGLYESAKRARAEGDLDSALELMRRSAIVSEDGGDIEDAAWARAVLSSWFLGKADAANVIAEQQHAISLFEQLDEGPRRYEGIANVSENAGRFNLTRGEIDEAFVDWKRAGEAFEKRLNKDEAAADDSELYMFLKRSVFLCIKMAKRRDDNSVFDGLKRLIQTFRHHPEMLLQLASALEQRANIRTDEKKHEDAIHLHDRRMDVLRILYGSENHLIASAQWERDHAEALSQLSSDDQVWSQKAKELRDGFVPLHTAGKFAELKDAGIQVMEIQRKTFGPDDYTVADAAHALGSAEIQMGNFQQAEKHFDKAARIIAQCFGKVHPIYANNRSSVAMVYERLGNRRKAIELYLEVDEILEATVGPQSNDYLLNQFNIGRLYREMGEWERSAKYVTDAFHAYRNSCSTDSLEFATALNEYAIVLQRQGDTDKAGELFVESMVIRVNQFGENHETVARSLNNIGNLLVESNSHADAIPFLEKSLTITESLGQSTSALQATVLFNLGWAIAVSGDHEKGEAILERCLTHAEKIYGTDSHQLVTECLQRLALLQWRKGRTESAADLLLRSARATRRSVEEFASILSDREHIEVNTRRREILDSLISIALAKPELQMEVSEELLKWKGSTTVRQTRMRQTKENDDTRDLYDDLRQISAELARVQFTNPSDAKTKALQDLSSRKNEMESELSRLSNSFKLATQTVSQNDLVAALPTETVLLDFVEFTKAAQKLDSEDWAETPSLLSILYRQGGEPLWFDLGPRKDINHQIETWRQSFSNPDRLLTSGLEIYRRVWQPMEEWIADTKNVIISTDGNLSRLPFDALPIDRSGIVLLQKHCISTVPVPQMFAESNMPLNSTQKRIEASKTKKILCVGGIDFDSIQSGVQSPRKMDLVEEHRQFSFSDLPGALFEVDVIENAYRKKHPLLVEKLTRSAATEAEFRRLAPGFEVLHVATHGVFPTSNGPIESSSNQSGIVFAGVNHPTLDGKNDGVLTAEEIAFLPLSNTRLVVLSACGTGLGQSVPGEGVLGLQRAFQIAGVESVLTTLWEVDDSATQRLMVLFHQNLLEGSVSSGEALRLAKLYLLEHGFGSASQDRPSMNRKKLSTVADERSPKFWAAFTLAALPRSNIVNCSDEH